MSMTWKTRYNASPKVCYSTKLKLPNCASQKIATFSKSYDYNYAWNPIRLLTLLAKALNEKNRKRWPLGATENDLLNKKGALIKKS